jgi:hypothetical protein
VTPAYNKTLYIQHDKENFQLPPEPHESWSHHSRSLNHEESAE